MNDDFLEILLLGTLRHTYDAAPQIALILTAGTILTGIPGLRPRDLDEWASTTIWNVRRFLLLGAVFAALWTVIVLPLLLYNLGTEAGAKAAIAALTRTWLPRVLVVIAAAAGARILLVRYASPRLSALARRFRVQQATDETTDIKTAIENARALNFDPRDHYTDGSVLTGLNLAHETPILTEASTFFETHKMVVGATRFGKGITFQSWIEQAAYYGNAVIYIDPKGDEFIPVIMREAAELLGRPYVHLDMNDDGRGTWAPLAGGSLQERKARMVELLGLSTTGSDADHYRITAKVPLEHVMDHLDDIGTSATFDSIGEAINLWEAGKSALNKTVGDLTDPQLGALFKHRQTLAAMARRRGLAGKQTQKRVRIDDVLMGDAVLYVKGSLDDDDLTAATRLFITEVLQAARRLKTRRTSRLSLFVDEVKFLVSETITKGLAVAANTNVDISLAYQNLGDLRTPADRTLDGNAVVSSVLANCQIKLIFGGTDYETAELVAKSSGTTTLNVAQREDMETDALGAEHYGARRSLQKVEQALIPENDVLTFPPRVACLLAPNQLASVLSVAPLRSKGTKAVAQRIADRDAAQAAKADASRTAALANLKARRAAAPTP